MFAAYNGFFWQTESCPAEPISHGAPLIFVHDEKCHIAFCYADGNIQYLCRENYYWDRQTLAANASEVAGIITDADGAPYIIYIDRDGNLDCASVRDQQWEFELIASPTSGLIGLWDSLAIDASDNLHLVYLDGTPPLSSTLNYAHSTASGWEIEAVEEGGLWAQIALGASYTAQITHVQSITQGDGTRYLSKNKLGWHSENIPIERAGHWSVASRMTAMVAGSAHIHIVYTGKDETDDGGKALLYIRGDQEDPVGPSVELSLNAYSFKMHDTMIVDAHITNGLEAVSIETKLWAEDPSGAVYSLLNPCSIFTLAPETDETVTVFEYVFSGREGPGDYQIFVRLINPITGEEYSLNSILYHFSAF